MGYERGLIIGKKFDTEKTIVSQRLIPFPSTPKVFLTTLESFLKTGKLPTESSTTYENSLYKDYHYRQEEKPPSQEVLKMNAKQQILKSLIYGVESYFFREAVGRAILFFKEKEIYSWPEVRESTKQQILRFLVYGVESFQFKTEVRLSSKVYTREEIMNWPEVLNKK